MTTTGTAPERWAEARRLLVVRLDGLGDVLMTTPAIRALAGEGGSRRSISLLTSPAGAALVPLLPEVDDVVVAAPPWLKGDGPRSEDVEADAAATRGHADRLRAMAFDGAVICTVNTQSALPAALLCVLAGIPLRLAHARENPYRLLTDWVPDPEPLAPVRHEVRRQLDLVATIGSRLEDEHLSVRVPPTAARAVRTLLAAIGMREEAPWVILHPGATAASRRYPTEAFGLVARGLTRAGVGVVVVGGAEDAEAVMAISTAGGPGVRPIAGALDLPHLAALLAVAPLLVANNSGPAHLAAAVGTPVVDLYALTNLQHAPWGVPSRILSHDVPCKGCRKSVCPVGHHGCLRGVPPKEVVEAALELLTARDAAVASVAAPPAGILPGYPVVRP